ncbi:hypothetical protein EWI07_14295 [Sporolactobacillus sp. THM7-4]|nr:hypothetical protein EWI07_14295 [Sporolactobacillus sp. THM7-4]
MAKKSKSLANHLHDIPDLHSGNLLRLNLTAVLTIGRLPHRTDDKSNDSYLYALGRPNKCGPFGEKNEIEECDKHRNGIRHHT